MQGMGFPVALDAYDVPLWKTFCAWIPGPAAAYAIGLLLMFGGAFLIQRMNYVVGLIREKTALPFLFFVLLISTNPAFFPLKSTSVGVVCLVLGLYQLFLSYHNTATQGLAYNWALLIGAGSLFWIPILWFMPLFWFGMYQLRSLSFRTFGATLFGFLTVYWLVLGWCVWQHDFTWFTGSFPVLVRFRPAVAPVDVWHLVILAWTGLLVLAAAINIFTHEYSDSLRTRENLSFLVVFCGWTLVPYFLYDSSEEFLVAACIPSSILMAHFFTVKWNKWVRGLFYLTIMAFMGFWWLEIWNN